MLHVTYRCLRFVEFTSSGAGFLFGVSFSCPGCLPISRTTGISAVNWSIRCASERSAGSSLSPSD